MQKIKVRYLKGINVSKWLNHYKISQKATLICTDNLLRLEGNRINEEINKILSVTSFSFGGLHYEKWLKLTFLNDRGNQLELYLMSGSWFGLENLILGNKRLFKLLRGKDSA